MQSNNVEVRDASDKYHYFIEGVKYTMEWSLDSMQAF